MVNQKISLMSSLPVSKEETTPPPQTATFSSVINGWGKCHGSKFDIGNGVTSTTAGSNNCGGNIIINLNETSTANFEVIKLPYKYCIELGIWVKGKGYNWRDDGVQHRCILSDGSRYGGYLEKLGKSKPFNKVGDQFGVELDILNCRARFVVCGEVQDTFDIPAGGVVVVVRLHTSSKIKLLPSSVTTLEGQISED